eukprot:TRINITY_DN1229_c0_g1_i2.p1 TRINITY_DN1229_c0_g1~~TRINITY_DN1229_c0_g1_i2.p1  ORF type:complete len:121 (-),score=12.30 TRINITY_DN1229_c0_g1_i2:3306-3668(-)
MVYCFLEFDYACIHLQLASSVGTFGRVLQCWDREMREFVAIKVVRSIRKYRDAAMIEIDILNLIAKNDRGGSRCVQIRNWFDYRNHICIVSIPMDFILAFAFDICFLACNRACVIVLFVA